MSLGNNLLAPPPLSPSSVSYCTSINSNALSNNCNVILKITNRFNFMETFTTFILNAVMDNKS
jgi:hypothetical protein